MTIAPESQNRHLFSRSQATSTGKQTELSPQTNSQKGRRTFKSNGASSSSKRKSAAAIGAQKHAPTVSHRTNSSHKHVTSPMQTHLRKTKAPYAEEAADSLQPMILGSTLLHQGQKKHTNPVRANNNLAQKLKLSKGGRLLQQNNSTKECTFCSPSLPHTVTHVHQHSDCFLNSQSSIARPKVPPRDFIMSNLGRKYGKCHEEFENLKVVNDLIYNEQTHMVSVFKDYLILDDINEFLKRFYQGETESSVRLPKLCDFYHKYSQVFPNFVSLPESKYMFRNIQRKQRLIDDQFNKANGGKTDEQRAGGVTVSNANARERQQSLLLTSQNRLFTTGFVDSVLNQKTCLDLGLEQEWEAQRAAAAQERNYQANVRRSDRLQQDRADTESQTTQKDNLDALIQKFVHKDTESTIRLNSSLGTFGDEILGETFRIDIPSNQRLSLATQDLDSRKAEIGICQRKSEAMANNSGASTRNRVSVISNQTGSFQKGASGGRPSGVKTVTGKYGPTPFKSGHQLKASTKKSQKTGSSGTSTRKSALSKQGVSSSGGHLQSSFQINSHLQKSSTLSGTLKQKVTLGAQASHIQQQLGRRYLQSQHPQAQSQKLPKEPTTVHKQQFRKSADKEDEHKNLRNDYLECDLGQPERQSLQEVLPTVSDEFESHKQASRVQVIQGKRASANVESGSQSPVDAVFNPLSAQPLLSTSTLNQKTTQPGGNLGFFKQRSSEIVLGSATPTQHLYHSKQQSGTLKDRIVDASGKPLPKLNLIQQQVESDYYSSGMMAGRVPAQFFRSQTAMNSVQNSLRPTLHQINETGKGQQAKKHVSRERSPPLMQSTKQLAKQTKQSPHRKKDRRTAALPHAATSLSSQQEQLYQTGKSSVSSLKQRVAQGDRVRHQSKTSLGTSGQSLAPQVAALYNLAPPPKDQRQGVPQSTTQGTANLLGSLQLQQPGKQQKFYSQTEINEAEEEYPDEEVADEIPDQDDTEDEQDHKVSDDEELGSSQQESIARDKLRPVDMIPTHGGAFQEEDSYSMQLAALGGKPRAQTTLAFQQKFSGTSAQNFESQPSQPAVTSSLSQYGSDRQMVTKASPAGVPGIISQPKPSDFNSTQQPSAIGRKKSQKRMGLQTEMDLRPTDPAASIQLTHKLLQMPITATSAANRPNTNLVTLQSMSIRSKFSRENSVSSRHETHPGATLQKPISVQESQRFFEASMKLGGKALLTSQTNADGSLRSSLEPSKQISLAHRPQQTTNANASSHQVSLSGTSRLQPKSTKASSSLPKRKQPQMQYKVDLNTRLASNLINEHIKKKADTGRKAGGQAASTTKLPLSGSTTFVHGLSKGVNGSSTHHGKPSSISKILDATASGPKQPRVASRGAGAQVSGASVPWKRKTVTSQSPPAPTNSHAKKISAETLGFKAMGSGKASYLTNVGIAATSNTLGATSSRNFTSPYSSQNHLQRYNMPKDQSAGSLPASKVMSRSPPLTGQDSLLMQQRQLLKTSNQNMTLQQQLQSINKQLGMPSKMSTSSFRGTAGVSPSQQSQNSVSKRTGLATSKAVTSAFSPQASSSLGNTAEKLSSKAHQSRKSLDRQGLSIDKAATSSSQQTLSTRLGQQVHQSRINLKQSSSSFQQHHPQQQQALISLPGGQSTNKALQKGLNLKLARSSATGSSKNSTLTRTETPQTMGIKPPVKGAKGLMQPRYSHQSSKAGSTALSPQPHGALVPKANGKMKKQQTLEAARLSQPVGSTHEKYLQQSVGELQPGLIHSIEEVTPMPRSSTHAQNPAKSRSSLQQHKNTKKHTGIELKTRVAGGAQGRLSGQFSAAMSQSPPAQPKRPNKVAPGTFI